MVNNDENHGYLVGGWATPLNNMSSSVGMTIPNIWKIQKKHKSDKLKMVWIRVIDHGGPLYRYVISM